MNDADRTKVEGYTAARTGSDLLACPYTLGSPEAIEWMLGHWAWQMEQGISILDLKVRS